MTAYQLTNRLDNLLIEMGFNPATLTDQTYFSEYPGLDSTGITDLFMLVEDSFGVLIDDERWHQLETVGQLKEYLQHKLQTS